jgi:hypothetical protein
VVIFGIFWCFVGDFFIMRSTGDFWSFFGDFLDWISWEKEAEDFAGLQEVSGEKKKKKKTETSLCTFLKKIYDFSVVD